MTQTAINYAKVLYELGIDKTIIEETEEALNEKMDRWVYLNDLAEKIEAQKRENNNENI